MNAAIPWSVSEATAQLREILEHAHATPQIIADGGQPCAVIVSLRDFQEFARMTRRQLRDFVLAPPVAQK